MSATHCDIVDEMFEIIGAKMGSQDPLVVAALFYTHKMEGAASAAAATLNRALEGLIATLQSSEKLVLKVE